MDTNTGFLLFNYAQLTPFSWVDWIKPGIGIITVLVSIVALTYPKKRRATIAMSYSVVEDNDMPSTTLGEKLDISRNLAIYVVFTIRNTGNTPFSLNEIFCVEKNGTSPKRAICRAPKLRCIEPKSYEITGSADPIYGKLLQPGEFCEYYWPIYWMNKSKAYQFLSKPNMKTMKGYCEISNDWINALGGNFRFTIEGDSKNNDLYSQPRILLQNSENADESTAKLTRSFYIRFGDGHICGFKNPNNIDDALEAARSKFFLTYSSKRPRVCRLSNAVFRAFARQFGHHKKLAIQEAPLYPEPYLNMELERIEEEAN